ncbi:globin-coupled sensor protein [Woodsholea maritima]|uniref:globin-coupled sensor protein n=1 Tax=Woodsholea maritima TaxID=240237 RepID=UPI0003706304|nr:globin-coupled sensor protein [Woodsholea maritima]
MSTPTRIDLNSRLKFSRLGETERQALKALKPLLMEQMPKILDGFYAHLGQWPDIMKMFGSKGPGQAKSRQAEHWGLILEGQFGDAYLRSVEAVGKTHARLELRPDWYFGAYTYLLNGMTEAVVKAQSGKSGLFGMGGGSTSNLTQSINVLTRAVMLDMDLVMTIVYEEGNRQRHQSMLEMANQFEASIAGVAEQVAKAATQMADSAQELSKTAEETNEHSSSVASASEEAVATADSVAQAASELTRAISEIAHKAGEAATTSGQANGKAADTGRKMSSLSEAASRIGEIVTVIERVAEQTNLLALNATIEAARAGEAGKGFAVVAQEVKALAEQTGKATEDISNQIAAMQQAVADSVGAIEGVCESIDEVNGVSASINAAVDEQSAATAEISRTTEQTAQAARSVSRSISAVQHGAERTSFAAGTMTGAAESLGSQAETLRREVDRFLSRIRAA